MEDNLGAAEVELSPEQVEKIQGILES